MIGETVIEQLHRLFTRRALCTACHGTGKTNSLDRCRVCKGEGYIPEYYGPPIQLPNS
jgi:DnaJ-class molecular chaperone